MIFQKSDLLIWCSRHTVFLLISMLKTIVLLKTLRKPWYILFRINIFFKQKSFVTLQMSCMSFLTNLLLNKRAHFFKTKLLNSSLVSYFVVAYSQSNLVCPCIAEVTISMKKPSDSSVGLGLAVGILAFACIMIVGMGAVFYKRHWYNAPSKMPRWAETLCSCSKRGLLFPARTISHHWRAEQGSA